MAVNSRKDFLWSDKKEPHVTRRKVILEKYPQIKKLFGYDPNFKWIVTAMVISQLIVFFFVNSMSWPVLFFATYFFGAVVNHSLMLAIHEIAHNLAFGHARPKANKLFGIFANLPIGIPFSASFKKYHLDHHKYQGDEIMDTDIPTYVEAELFGSTLGKLIWIIFQPFFYTLRPLFTYPLPLTLPEAINIAVQLIFDVLVYYFIGGKVLLYMVGGSIMGTGLHPVAGHFIAEHYMFHEGYETYSYYGIFNVITFNVGYHNEHHDFPAVPGSRLPEVKRIAEEFYANLPQHNSWIRVLYDFITDPQMGHYARIKRKHYYEQKLKQGK